MARKVLRGTIIKKSGNATYHVQITRKVKHVKYKKIVELRKQYLVHSTQDYNVGDEVNIVASRKISKNKYFVILPEIKTKIAKKKNA